MSHVWSRDGDPEERAVLIPMPYLRAVVMEDVRSAVVVAFVIGALSGALAVGGAWLLWILT